MRLTKWLLMMIYNFRAFLKYPAVSTIITAPLQNHQCTTFLAKRSRVIFYLSTHQSGILQQVYQTFATHRVYHDLPKTHRYGKLGVLLASFQIVSKRYVNCDYGSRRACPQTRILPAYHQASCTLCVRTRILARFCGKRAQIIRVEAQGL